MVYIKFELEISVVNFKINKENILIKWDRLRLK